MGCHFSIPSLLPTIQDRLLECISVVLSKSQHPQGRSVVGMGRGNLMNIPQHVSDLGGSALVQLALQTLSRFNFKVCVHNCISKSISSQLHVSLKRLYFFFIIVTF